MRDRAAVDAVRAALADPVEVCRRLGLLERAQRAGNGILICCPAHGERHPSCSVHVARDRTLAVKCWACGWTGDIFTLAAAVEHLDLRADFRAVLARTAELARVSLDDPPARRALPELPPREPPPAEEVRRLLARARDVRRDPEAAAWLCSRGLSPAACSRLAWVLRAGPRWASYRGDWPRPRPWAETGHRLLLPVVDALGQVRSVRARAVRADAAPKSLPPSGFGTAGLVLASPAAARMLRAGAPGARQRVVVAEGEPDFLTWASRVPGAVLGLPGSGGWTSAIADRIPDGSEVVIRTDPDPAGDRYAAAIAESLRGRCTVRVSDAAGRRARRAGGTERGLDDNDLLRRGDLPDDPAEGTEVLHGH